MPILIFVIGQVFYLDLLDYKWSREIIRILVKTDIGISIGEWTNIMQDSTYLETKILP